MPRKGKKSQAKKVQWRAFQSTVTEGSVTEGRVTACVDEISVRASYHQGDHLRFPGESVGRQCVPNSTMFLASLHEGREIDQNSLDQILQRGDMLYRDVQRQYEARNCVWPNVFSTDDLPELIKTDRGQHKIEKSLPVFGYLLEGDERNVGDFASLAQRLEHLGQQYSFALLIVGSVSICVFRDRQDRYGFFDPHSRTADGSQAVESGTAVMVTFSCVADLLQRLVQLLCISLNISDEPYELTPISFNSMVPSQMEVLPVHTAGLTGVEQAPRVSTAGGKCRAKRVADKLRRTSRDERKLTLPHTTTAADRKREYDQRRYNLDIDFRDSKKSHVKDRYASDPTYRERQKRRVTDSYSNDPEYRKRQKRIVTDSYATDPEYRERQKRHVTESYANDPEHRHKQKRHVTDRYANDPEFRERQKRHVTQRYANDPDYRERQKEDVVQNYANDPMYRERQKEAVSDAYRTDPLCKMRKKSRGVLAEEVRNKMKELRAINANQAQVHREADVGENDEGLPESDNSQQPIDVVTECNPAVELAILQFKTSCREEPIYKCVVCAMSSFPHGVKRVDQSKYTKDPELANMCLSNPLHECEDACTANGECLWPGMRDAWICQTCNTHLLNGTVPPKALANCMDLDPIPAELEGLNAIERQLIAKVISFQKIVTLPKGQQRAIHGAVVNVPSEVEAVVDVLPRPRSEAQLLQVMLKRRLHFKGYQLFQTVDMSRVLAALHVLKGSHPAYENVSLRYDTEEEDAISSLLEHSDENPAQDSSAEHSEDEDNEEEDTVQRDDTVAQQHAVPFDSCLQPSDIGQEVLSFGSNVYSIAPAEGNRPASFFSTPGLEAMAFPVQFCQGRFTIDEPNRMRKITPSQYFKARLFHFDTRFARDTSYIFFAQFATEMHLAMSSMSIQMRKGMVTTRDGRVITSSLLRDKDEVQRLIQHEQATRFMQPLRGTPAYWERTTKDLFAILRQLGMPTFFCTFSAAETRWPEIIESIAKQQGRSVNFDEMDWMSKCEILRSNPVTVIRMFNKRVDDLMKHLILSDAQPIGNVVDYFYRVEFQARGSAHIHCLFWVEDAPKFGEQSDDAVAAFVDRHISCRLPDPDTDPELHDIVKAVQSHSMGHTKSCKKGNRHCRFGFPKPPIKATYISHPLPPQDDSVSLSEAKAKLATVWNLLHEPLASAMDTDDILRKCGMTYVDFSRYLDVTTSKLDLKMRRDPKDCWVNNYNPHLLRAWNANMDIQFVLDAYSAIVYILSYVTKPEHELSEFLKTVVHGSARADTTEMEQMKQIMQAYAKNREMSIQEAVARVCGLKLKLCSRNVVFIQTDDNALKMSLPLSQLQNRDPDSDNIWMSGLPEKYKARPADSEFESMCMADFASQYRIVYGRQQAGRNTIRLQNNMGFIQKRTKRDAVIRYTRFSEATNPEKHFGTLLKVFLPYRSEAQLKTVRYPTFESFYNGACVILPGQEEVVSVKKIVEDNKQRYVKDDSEVERAIQDLSASEPMENAWSNLAPNSELIRLEAISERQPLDFPEEEQEDVPELSRDSQARPAVPLMVCPEVDTAEIRRLYRSLNETQAAVFYQIRDWCLRRVNGQEPNQFFYFVTGGAGTGKSHVIKCIYNEATKILRRLPAMRQEEDIVKPTVILTSFTGTAAFNIGGNTLHSVFKLPMSLRPPYQGLGNSLDEVRIIMSHLQILVIDEVSMVSKELFAYVDLRLQQIKGKKTPFGGVSVLCVGDFFQLAPVGKSKPLCIFEDNAVNIWTEHFQMIALSQIMRQRDDAPFAELLNRIRVKRKDEPLQPHDRALLQTRIYASKEDCPRDVLHIFPKNKDVDAHNNAVIQLFSTDVVYVDAEDFIKDARTGRMVKQAAPFPGKKEDLPDKLSLSEGARIVIIRNLDTSDGLVNGTFGKVSKLVTNVTDDGKLYVRMIGLTLDNPAAGAKRKSATDENVYIERVEERCKRKGVVRFQFPLKLAFACTAHKTQGSTTLSAVVSLKGVFEAGMSYVALSRTTSLNGLHIIDFDEKKIYCNEEVLNALEDMPRANISVMPLLTYSQTTADKPLTLIHHNIEGLHHHFEDMKSHHEISLADILCLTETHLTGSVFPRDLEREGYNVVKRNREVSYSNFPQIGSKQGGGVAIYTKTNIVYSQMQYVMNVTDLEFVAIKVTHPVKAVVAAVYRPPSYRMPDFKQNLNHLLAALEITDQDNVIVCGDFNEDSKSSTTPIKNLFTSRGYEEIIQDATTDKNTNLDQIFTQNPQKCLASGVLASYYSYHRPVFAVFN